MAGFPPPPPKVSPAAGVIDFHVHSEPDVFQVSVKDVATAVKEIGADHLVLSTDLGQQGMMTHPDGMEQMISQVKKQGVSQEDIDRMVKTNPARLLGLGT